MSDEEEIKGKELKKEELEGDDEVPLEIQDYTNINKWEQLVNNFEVTLIKWNIRDPLLSSSKLDTKITSKLTEKFVFCNTNLTNR